MRFLAWLAPALPMTLVFACGGAVSHGIGPGDGGSGGDGSPSAMCPAPASVGGGLSCATPGLDCPSTGVIRGCNGAPDTPVDCLCQNGTWECLVSQGCPTQGCPVPSSVQPGASCSTSSEGLSCQSDIGVSSCGGPTTYLQCTCYAGAWSCPKQKVPACPCPPADSTFSGAACSPYGASCPGDPTQCGGNTFYDDLQCQNGTWTIVASTACDIDGGAITDAAFDDASTGD